MRNQGQLRASYFAPGAGITVAQLNEVDRAIVLGARLGGKNADRMGLDLYKRSRTQDRIHRVILGSNEAVLAMANVKFLDQSDRDFAPNLDHSRDQGGCPQTETLVKPDRKCHGFLRICGFKRRQMSMLKRKG